jgi:hypothetical protein
MLVFLKKYQHRAFLSKVFGMPETLVKTAFSPLLRADVCQQPKRMLASL